MKLRRAQNPSAPGWAPILLVWVVAGAVAMVSALPYAGGWNDAAWLASVESLVDYHTLAIDRSIYVGPARSGPGTPAPYLTDHRLLMDGGTKDMIRVDGHYYAAKPPVLSVLMAGGYQGMQWCTGITARNQPAQFAYGMTLCTSGVAYTIAAVCIYLLLRRVLQSEKMALVLTASFSLGTLALAYARHVNSHILFLATSAALMLSLDTFGRRLQAGSPPWLLAAGVGTLAGLGYASDGGVGPVMMLCLLPLVLYRCSGRGLPGLALVAIVLLAAFPWFAAHHGLNYLIGHSFVPANAVPENLQWPGSPWSANNMSGRWNHTGWVDFLGYAGELAVGRKGFLTHNLVLLVAVVGGAILVQRHRRQVPEMPELLFGFAWSIGAWLLYSWGSDNYAGLCVSIRWFLPLLAPGYYAVAVLLRQRPGEWAQTLVASFYSGVFAVVAWFIGPWMPRMVPGYWYILGATLLSWIACVGLVGKASPFTSVAGRGNAIASAGNRP